MVALVPPPGGPLQLEPDWRGLDALEVVLETLTTGVYLVDREGRIVRWNRGAEQATGFAASDVIGRSCADGILVHIDADGSKLCTTTGCPVSHALGEGAMSELRVLLHHKAGHRVPALTRAAPIRDGNGRVAGAVVVFTDESARAAVSQEVERLRAAAMLDPLTGIGNRRCADRGLRTMLDEAGRYGWPFGAVLLDIDNFKVINDTYGHRQGDEALKVVARTLAGNVRSFDVVARWGGEEFLVLLANISADQLPGRAEAMRRYVEQSALVTPVGAVKVTASIGATLVRPEDTPETLVERADALMYQAKRAGRNRVALDE